MSPSPRGSQEQPDPNTEAQTVTCEVGDCQTVYPATAVCCPNCSVVNPLISPPALNTDDDPEGKAGPGDNTDEDQDDDHDDHAHADRLKASFPMLVARGQFRAALAGIKLGVDKDGIPSLAITLAVGGSEAYHLNANLGAMLGRPVNVALGGESRQLALWDLSPE